MPLTPIGLSFGLILTLYFLVRQIRKGTVSNIHNFILQLLNESIERTLLEEARLTGVIVDLEAQLAAKRLKLVETHRLEEALRVLIEQFSDGKPPEAVRIDFYEILGGTWQRIETMASIKATESKTYGIRPKDSKGNDAKLDGPAEWALTDPAMGAFEPAADGLTAKLTPTGPVASLAIQVTGDAKEGPGVVPIIGTFPLEIIAGDAVTIEVFEAV